MHIHSFFIDLERYLRQYYICCHRISSEQCRFQHAHSGRLHDQLIHLLNFLYRHEMAQERVRCTSPILVLDSCFCFLVHRILLFPSEVIQMGGKLK